jgi:hypothetical protein
LTGSYSSPMFRPRRRTSQRRLWEVLAFSLVIAASPLPTQIPGLKKVAPNRISDLQVDRCYEVARSNGAVGAKIMGAGGGLFVFYCPNHHRVRLRQG